MPKFLASRCSQAGWAARLAPGVAALNAAGIPTFSYPDTAARAFIICGISITTCVDSMKLPP